MNPCRFRPNTAFVLLDSFNVMKVTHEYRMFRHVVR
jgi:hypothetical protein